LDKVRTVTKIVLGGKPPGFNYLREVNAGM
jgi:hypothetical protein